MRDKMIALAMYTCFALVGLSIFYTQVLRYPYYNKLARNNVIRIVPINGPRGNIFDRNGSLLVTDRLSFDVAIVYQELINRQKLLNILTETLPVSRKDIARALEESRLKPYASVVIAEDVDKEKALMLEEASFDVRALAIETKSRRHYIYNEAGSHIFGYLSEITEKELEDLRDYGYRPKNLLGRDGLEKYYNRELTGREGGLQIEVDNRGRHVKTLGLKEPLPGKDLLLTIDASLQVSADRLLGDKTGAVIVMDPHSGEILALASHPPFDPNIFVKPNTSDERVRLLKDKLGRPLFNRAISGVYPPGSVFKIVTASAALQTHHIGPLTRFVCTGSYMLGSAKFDCWKDTGHGSQDIRNALMNSCNVFFYNTGKAAGADNIEAYARLFGFGRPTGIDLPDEAKGIAPGKKWKRFYRKDSWYEGDTLNYAIGQGYLLVTPIQILEMLAVIANGGSIVKPYIVKKIGDIENTHTAPKGIGLKNNVIQEVKEGLFKVINGETGTGKLARVDGVSIAGKTGTAQNPQGETHAWFTGFAPYDNPKICLVVLLEHGGKGSYEPAGIAKEIFREAKMKGYL